MSWTNNENYNKLVKSTWENKLCGSFMFTLLQKQKLLKKNTKIWCKSHPNNNFRQLKDIEDQLLLLQTQQITGNYNDITINKRQRLLNKREALMNFNNTFWKQRVKSNFLKFGDMNTKYYQSIAKIRNSKNITRNFTNKSGLVIEDENQIRDEITNELAERFISNKQTTNNNTYLPNLINRTITDSENLTLTRPFTDKEIKDTLFSMKEDKSPGPDGFPPEFYKKYWNIVGSLLCKAIKSFFHSGILLNEVNTTFIALILKIDNPININHYRPISLCNTIYKIISKLLANRLKPILPRIINPFQEAFVQGRNIQDNILIAHEVFHSFHNKKGKYGWMAIKLDMEKAYDKINWDYIRIILTKFGFHQKWIN